MSARAPERKMRPMSEPVQSRTVTVRVTSDVTRLECPYYARPTAPITVRVPAPAREEDAPEEAPGAGPVATTTPTPL